MIQQSIGCDDPVIFFEPKRRYWEKAPVDRAPAQPERAAARGAGRPRRHRRDPGRLRADGAHLPGPRPPSPRTRACRWRSSTCARSRRWTCNRSSTRCAAPAGSSSCTRRRRIAPSPPRSPHRSPSRRSSRLQAPVLRVTGFDIPYPPSRFEAAYLPDLDRILDAVDRSRRTEVRRPVVASQQFRLPDLGEGLTEGEISAVARRSRGRRAGQPADRRGGDGEGGGRGAQPSCRVVVRLWPRRARRSTSAPRSSRWTFSRRRPAPGETDSAERSVVRPPAPPMLPHRASRPSARRPAGAADRPAPGRRTPAGPGRLRRQGLGHTRRARKSAPIAAAAATPAAPAAAAGPSAPPPAVRRGRTAAGRWPRRRSAGSPETSGCELEACAAAAPAASISREDVHRAASAARPVGGRGLPERRTDGQPGTSPGRPARAPPRPRGAGHVRGDVTSAFTAPHASVSLAVDVTASMRLRERLAGYPTSRGCRSARCCSWRGRCWSRCRRHPLINSSWDEAAQEIVVQPAVNLGIAVATPSRAASCPTSRTRARCPCPGWRARLAT